MWVAGCARESESGGSEKEVIETKRPNLLPQAGAAAGISFLRKRRDPKAAVFSHARLRKQSHLQRKASSCSLHVGFIWN
jgi:hypothetical protein